MKIQHCLLIAFICSSLTAQVFAQSTETVAAMPDGDYPIKKFEREKIFELEKLSDEFSGMQKIEKVDSLNPNGVLSSERWPEGAWGRGYQTWPNVKFYPLNPYGYYWSCHPLVRDAACFTNGHLMLYLSDGSFETSKRLAIAGVDFLLDEQIKKGKNKGHFIWWLKREGIENLNMEMPINNIQPYETAYALVTLCNFYSSGIDHRREEVKAAIDLSTDAMLKLNWEKDHKVANSNMRSLGIWSLSAAYRTNRDEKIYEKIKGITEFVMASQNLTPGTECGLWTTGGTDEVDGYKIPHDSKIYYHMMIMRGLIEAFRVATEEDSTYKAKVADAIKRGMSHVILYRVDRENKSNYKLKYASKTIDDRQTPNWYSHDLVDIDKVIEPLVKIAYYSWDSNYFSEADHQNLVKVAVQVGQGLNESEIWYTCSIGFYALYMNALVDEKQLE